MPEKFDAVEGTSNIDAEYGNQVRATPTDVCLLSSMLMCMASYRAPTSTSSRAKALAGPSLSPSAFSFAPPRSRSMLVCRTNASYQVGLSIITQFQRRALGALTPPDSFFRHGRVLTS